VPDDAFEQQLAAGAEQLAASVSPRAAGLIRARGDQRRRRKIASSLALALAVIAGGGGTAYAIGQHVPGPTRPLAPAATGGTASPGHKAGTRTFRFGPLILRVPASWYVNYRDARGDYTVSTTPCNGDELVGAERGSTCPSFSLIADAGPTSSPSGVGTHAYVPGQDYTTSTRATGCPAKRYPNWLRDTPAKLFSSGYAPVTSTRIADYTVWRFGCSHAAGAPSFHFQQRDWYLPESRILIVDEYSVPGLAQILASATWAG
jgi:hypothetical protein